MNPTPFALAVAAAAAPPAIFWWSRRTGRPWLGLLLAALLLVLGPLAVGVVVGSDLETLRGAWLDGAPHDWSALDQPGRKALIEDIRTRLAHGKLIAGLPAIARGLAAGGVALQCVGWAYARWQARRQPVG